MGGNVVTFIVIIEDHQSVRAFGPFPAAARASGFGFSRFGALTFGNPNKWRVRPVEKRS
jgi:hypothetical protein